MKSKKQQERNKQIIREANARRKVNKSWEQVENKRRYKYAVISQLCGDTTTMIEEECFDGILLQLNERNESKSQNTQKRLLRRIIEKRQAQSIHKAIGRTCDRFVNHMQTLNTSRSIKELHRMQFCA